MEFKQILINNFLSYYKENCIDFSELTTVILGQNTTGKSKLFDAINWGLFHRIYITDIYSWVTDVKEIQKTVLNRRAIREAIDNEENEVGCSVKLKIKDGINTIIIERNYSYVLDGKEPKIIDSSLILFETDEVGNLLTQCENEKAEAIIYEKFPNEIRDFFLFQGEAASQILKLHRGSKFTSAVRKIAKLENFETAKNISDKFLTTSRNIFKKNMNQNAQVKQQQEKLEKDIIDLQEDLPSLEKKLEDAEKDKANYQQKVDEDVAFLASQKDFEDLFGKKQDLIKQQKDAKSIAATLKEESLDIADSWVFYKVRDKVKNFYNFYKKLEKKGNVPPVIPQSEINKALEEHKCPICDTVLPENSDIWKHIQSKVSKLDVDRLGKELQGLQYAFQYSSSSIDSVPDRIHNYYRRKTDVEEKRNNLAKRIESLEKDIENIRVTETNAEMKKKIEEANTRLSTNNKFLKRSTDDFNYYQARVRIKKEEIENKNKEVIKIAATNNIDMPIEDKIQLKYASLLNKAISKLAEETNKLAFSKIQEAANLYYKEMTEENPSVVGELCINFQDSDIYTINTSGQRINDINQANRVSIQLAVIAGILTVAESQFGEQYPFVTDAPISDLGGANKLPTIRSMIQAFEQSILILKDDATKESKKHDEVRKLIQTEERIGAAYELIVEPNKDQDLQYTKIVKIK